MRVYGCDDDAVAIFGSDTRWPIGGYRGNCIDGVAAVVDVVDAVEGVPPVVVGDIFAELPLGANPDGVCDQPPGDILREGVVLRDELDETVRMLILLGPLKLLLCACPAPPPGPPT